MIKSAGHFVDPELLAAVDEIADELKADGIRVFVYG